MHARCGPCRGVRERQAKLRKKRRRPTKQDYSSRTSTKVIAVFVSGIPATYRQETLRFLFAVHEQACRILCELIVAINCWICIAYYLSGGAVSYEERSIIPEIRLLAPRNHGCTRV